MCSAFNTVGDEDTAPNPKGIFFAVRGQTPVLRVISDGTSITNDSEARAG
jgi:hypothetical protein